MESDATCTTKERLIEAATRLFAIKGLEGTPTRTIVAEAQANLSSIPFHFKTKDNLYRTALEQAIKKFDGMHRPIYDEIDAATENGLMDSDMAWAYIVQLIGQIIDWCFSQANFYETMLIYREVLYPSSFSSDLYTLLMPPYQYLEKLLYAASGSTETLWARNYSYLTISSLYNYSNQPHFMKSILNQDEQGIPLATIKMQLRRDVLCGIHAVIRSRSAKQSHM